MVLLAGLDYFSWLGLDDQSISQKKLNSNYKSLEAKYLRQEDGMA